MDAKDKVPKPCPGNAYCNPTLNLCPAGSQTQGNKKTLISDCKLKAGYYCKVLASSATTACTIAVCEPGSFCPGGVPINTVSGYNGMTPCDCTTKPGCPSSLPGSTSAAACSCVPCAIDQPCDAAADCSSSYCFNNKCTADPCAGDPCGVGNQCNRNGATYTCEIGGTCSGDSSCSSGYCSSGQCAADPCAGDPCGVGNQCNRNGATYTCEIGGACSGDSSCSSGYCFSNTCAACTSDADCGAGRTCDLVNGGKCVV
jgi:hypothetical protein